MLTLEEVAERLKCHVNNVRNLINDGILPYVPIGRKKGFRILEEDLEAFIQSRRVQEGGKKKPPPRHRLKHIRV